MHLFPLSRILAVLVAVAVSSAINPDIDAAHNANPKRCAWNWEVYRQFHGLRYKFICIGELPALPGWMKRSFKICRDVCGICGSLNKMQVSVWTVKSVSSRTQESATSPSLWWFHQTAPYLVMEVLSGRITESHVALDKFTHHYARSP
ncbi:hypothetical protein F5J12DRAFT_779946 [Pisolithus orientalis]|uniref:uncharacterized protein n=1 Tax=Pisolithus orientalis TaxID=936130 RepID=UPI002224D14C|nr:uncharacterized protein F5J12DRAFT_779946 [Pisolithus orientalis]KAI6030929.1 hypothetical protein F5J12DRAFT_779946 [Pisolithus orientalis]